MFGKAKGGSHKEGEHLPPAPQLQDSTPANVAEADSTEISYIGPGMTVVGKISSEGTLNVFGRVEGELHASIVRISDGAHVEGAIAVARYIALLGYRFFCSGSFQSETALVRASDCSRNWIPSE